MEFLDESPVEYRCTCSRERYGRALLSLGEEDLAELSQDPCGIELKCQFCGKKYHFSEGELRSILAEKKKMTMKKKN